MRERYTGEVQVLGTFFESTLLIFASEMGDKTQLLAFTLSARYKKPLPIMAGILVATLLNHALSAWLGSSFSNWIEPKHLWIGTGVAFILFGFWALIPDKEDETKESNRFGPFFTTAILFFMAEIGDKTQLATVALGAKTLSPVSVTAGTTLGMMLSDGLAVFLGARFYKWASRKEFRIASALLFFLFGALSIRQGLNHAP